MSLWHTHLCLRPWRRWGQQASTPFGPTRAASIVVSHSCHSIECTLLLISREHFAGRKLSNTLWCLSVFNSVLLSCASRRRWRAYLVSSQLVVKGLPALCWLDFWCVYVGRLRVRKRHAAALLTVTSGPPSLSLTLNKAPRSRPPLFLTFPADPHPVTLSHTPQPSDLFFCTSFHLLGSIYL